MCTWSLELELTIILCLLVSGRLIMRDGEKENKMTVVIIREVFGVLTHSLSSDGAVWKCCESHGLSALSLYMISSWLLNSCYQL